jgi:CHAD domain-containing protein
MDQRFAVDGVDAHSHLRQAAPAILLAKAEPLFELEASASGGADMDAVHDMRVASRRLRESMRLLAPLYPPAAFSAWYKRVRCVTRALGPVRDSDVFIDAFAKLNRSLDAGGRHAVAFLVGYRMGQRERQLELLQRALASLDLAESRRSFAKLVRAPKRGVESQRPLSAFAHAAIAERISAVYGLMPAALNEADIESQHALRISFKRLRYAVEVLAPCYGDDFDGLHATLTAFQDELGDLHDLHVFLDMVREPERRAAAEAAGVSAEDLGDVDALLEKKAHREFTQFAKLAKEHPAGDMLSALLLPLSRAVDPEVAVDPAETAGQWDTGAAAASQALAVAGVVEPPPAEIPIADFGGYAINPPIVVGATPWAVAHVAEPHGVRGTAPEAPPAAALTPAPAAEASAPATAPAPAAPIFAVTAPATAPAPTDDPEEPAG